jgi:hypothetical protein
MPADARLVQQQFERTRHALPGIGLDYSGTFYNDGRSVTQREPDPLRQGRP